MRISAGIAEISFTNLQGTRPASDKFFVWPLYNAGRIDSIHGVSRRTESNALYLKPSPEDRERILNIAKNHSENEYSSSGKIGNTPTWVRPGSLFEALA